MSKKTTPAHREKELEDELFEAMHLKGLMFPQTAEEVIRVEQEMKKSKPKLPPELSDPSAVLQRAKTRQGHTRAAAYKLSSPQVADNLAMAARKGSEITPEIREQMIKDRKRSESGANDE